MRLPNVLWFFVVLIAISVLVVIIPALSKAKDIVRRTVCSMNLQGVSAAMCIYMIDSEGQYPASDEWCDLQIQEVDASLKIFRCPLDFEDSFSYAINENVYKVTSDELPSQFVVLFEADLGRNGVGGSEDLVLRHDESGKLGCNIAFADGHVEFVTEDRIPSLQWTIEE